ncbi:MAG: hypothetical protein KDK60_00420 [Chlamydiia bacterium]|nr:hypothetical protein [Chlamydiia bacterium]
MDQQPRFIGRNKELRRLQDTRDNQIADLVVITGRRRIGKTRLAEEFGKSFSHVFSFTGLPPTKGITAQKQRDHFAQQLLKQTRLPPPSARPKERRACPFDRGAKSLFFPAKCIKMVAAPAKTRL